MRAFREAVQRVLSERGPAPEPRGGGRGDRRHSLVRSALRAGARPMRAVRPPGPVRRPPSAGR